MLMMTSQILKSVDFTKTKKSRYLQNDTLFQLQIKIFINCALRASLRQKNSFVEEVTFKGLIEESESAVKWFRENNMIVTPDKFQAIVLEKGNKNNNTNNT